MPNSKDTGTKAKLYMLTLIKGGDRDFVSKTMEAYEIGRSTVYAYLERLIQQGKVERQGGSYSVVQQVRDFSYRTADLLSEDQIFDRDIAPLLRPVVNADAFVIWRYAFTEMMNNAIEHADAREISCRVALCDVDAEIRLVDDGIGIFRRIIRYTKETTGCDISEEDAVALLFPGKFTTNKACHSGEGIFFTSRALDRFAILSGTVYFSHTPFHEKQDEPVEPLPHGTAVLMSLSNTVQRKLRDVFNHYSNPDDGFYKTQIPVAMMLSDFPVSRSEARRLCSLFDQFSEVELDFDRVEQIGQAFAHELFVVYAGRNPHLKIEITHANCDIQNMISRVVNTT